MRSRASSLSPALLSLVLGSGCGTLAQPASTLDAQVEAHAEPLRDALSPDEQVSAPAIAALRARGPEGLHALLERYQDEIAAIPATASRPETTRLRHAIDRVAGQRDAFASGLYWHTDLEAAKAEAHATGRLILSLRLLGRLDEELSCANSRFFRVLVYPDPQVREALAAGFVLHWSSERPVPRVTIDMGDGRSITRTLTGNSAHYVMDAHGRVLDVLPGLYSSGPFVEALARSRVIAARCASMDTDSFRPCLEGAHTSAKRDLEARWVAVQDRIPGRPALAAVIGADAPLRSDEEIAQVVSLRAMGKARIEAPLFAAIGTPSPAIDATGELWRVGLGSVPPLSPAAVALVRLKLGARTADVGSESARLAEVAAIDAIRNDFVLHRMVHDHFISEADVDFASLNTWVYATVFRTSREDPWLGLGAMTVFDAVEDTAP